MTFDEAMTRLMAVGEPKAVAMYRQLGRARVRSIQAPTLKLRGLAEQIGQDHALGLQLWDTGLLEARMIAGRILDAYRLTRPELDRWVGQIDSLEVMDVFAGLLVAPSPLAPDCAADWWKDPRDWVRRTALRSLRHLAGHPNPVPDEVFEPYLKLCQQQTGAARGWLKEELVPLLIALGSRNPALRIQAVKVAEALGSTALEGAPPGAKLIDPRTALNDTRLYGKLGIGVPW